MTHPPNEPATPATDPDDAGPPPPPQGTPPETPDPRTKLDPDHDDDDPYDSGGEPLGAAGKRGLRQRAQKAEAERDELRTRVDRFARRDAERLAAELLTDGGDLWSHGVKLDDVLNDDGDIDAEKVRTVARDVAAQHPHWARGGAAAPADQVTSDGKVPIRGNQTPTFGDVLKHAAQRGRASRPNN